MHQDDWSRVQQALDDHFRNRRPELECEHRLRTRSGEWIWVLARGKVFVRDERGGRDLENQVNGTRILTVSLRDITEQRRVEDQQRFLSEPGAVLASTLDRDVILTNIGQLVTRSFDSERATKRISLARTRCARVRRQFFSGSRNTCLPL